jgi:hypothetical protein
MLRSVGAGARATALGHPVGTGQLVSLTRSTAIVGSMSIEVPGHQRRKFGSIESLASAVNRRFTQLSGKDKPVENPSTNNA